MRPATGDAFRNITVNTSTISADSVTDTLTLVAGTNVTLTANVETDSITIAAGAASTGDFTFTNSAASVPVNATLTLTALNNTTKESKLTLSPTTTSSLYAANNLQLGIGYGTGSELYWTFDAVGTLTTPGRIVTPEIEGKLDSLAIFSDWTKDTGISIVSTDNLESVTIVSDRLAAIVTNVGPSEKQWIFGADGSTQFPSYKFPSADGSVNQVLSTNGSGTLSWSTPYTSTYIGTTAISFNRSSAAQTLTGITSIDGSAGSVAAANITGTTLASGVTGSSLTSVGTLTSLSVSGALTLPNRTAFRVVGNGSTGITATTTLTSTHFTVDYQQGSALNTTTGIFTAPTAGLYSVHLVMRTNSNSSGTISQAIVIKNVSTALCMLEFAPSTTMNHTGVSTIAQLAVGDTLKVVVSVGTLNFDGNDNWSVAFIG